MLSGVITIVPAATLPWPEVAALLVLFAPPGQADHWYSDPAHTLDGVIALDDDASRTPIGSALLVRNPGGQLEIGKVWVAETHRKRGLGKRLVSTLLERCAQVDEPIVLTSERSNEPASALYHSLGFIKTDLVSWDCETNERFVVWRHPSLVAPPGA